jgi:hypothetical protein
VSVAEKPPPVAGSWGSLPGDIESTEPAKIRLYIARTAADSRALLCAESVDGDYVAFGRALGYPACCIEAAVQADGMVLDPKSGRLRQRSLTAVSARASRGADFRCNHFLLESPIDASGPVSPVSHYPCRLDCEDSAAFGGEVLAMAQKLWPLWHSQWLRLLRSPMIYWPDDEWPFEFRDEYAGLALVHANLDEGPSATWHSATHALPLGRGQTPMGALPTSVVRGCIVPSGVLLESPDSSTLLPHASLGKPLILDWSVDRCGLQQTRIKAKTDDIERGTPWQRKAPIRPAGRSKDE